MNKKVIVLCIGLLFFIVGLSGCIFNNENEERILKINVQNNASYHIIISVDFTGEDFTFFREMQVDRGKINSVSIPLDSEEDKLQVDFTVTASYVDYSDITDVEEESWTIGFPPNSHEFYFKVFGVIDSNNIEDASIQISGALDGFD